MGWILLLLTFSWHKESLNYRLTDGWTIHKYLSPTAVNHLCEMKRNESHKSPELGLEMVVFDSHRYLISTISSESVRGRKIPRADKSW